MKLNFQLSTLRLLSLPKCNFQLKLLATLTLALLFASCQTKTNDFIIKNKQVGKLTDTTTVAQMKQLYQNDSIVKKTHAESAFEPYDEYTIIDKETKKVLMLVVPQKINDEQSLLKQIEIKSPEFKTEKGVGIFSDFGDFKKQHKIGHLDETFKYIVVFIDDLNATISISKDVVPLNAQNNAGVKIDETLIPDKAKIKGFIVFFE